jgi:hypothetical protein
VQQDARTFNLLLQTSSAEVLLFSGLQQLRQLGDIRRDPSRLIFGEQRCVGATAS